MKSFFKWDFPINRAHGYFMGSAAVVQLIPLITAPIIARLYTPADFGAYAIFFGLVAIISSFSQLALHNAILLAATDSEAALAHLLAVSVSIIISALVFCTQIFIPEHVITTFFGPALLKLLPWLPVTVLITSVYTCFYTWWVRQGLYTELGRNKLILGISTAVIQVCIGLVGLDAIGFVWANLIGITFALFLLLGVIVHDMRALNHGFTLVSAWKQFVKHKALVLYTTPAGLINSASSYIPDYFINLSFGPNTLGQYSLANRMVNMPLSFLSVSVQDIFRQEASLEFTEKGHCRNTFNRFFKLMLLVGLCILVPFMLVLPYIFPIIFGSQWSDAGALIQPLIILIVVRFISSPLSYVWIIQGYQRLDMLWQSGLMLLTVASLFLVEANNLEAALWSYSICCGLWYVLCIFLSFRFSGLTQSQDEV